MQTTELQGSVSRSIRLRTNDPKRSTADLTLTVEVVGSVVLLPQARLSVGSGRGSNPQRRLLVRKDLRERGDLVISGLSTSQPWLKARARRVEVAEPAQEGFPSAAPGDWIIEVDLVEGHPSGVRHEKLRFKTGLSVEKEVEVPVAVSVIPPLVLRPQEVVLQPVEDHLEGSLLVAVSADRSAERLSVEAWPERLSVSLLQSGPRHYRVVVSLPADQGSALREGKLTLRVGDESASVPVSVGAPGPAASP